MKLHLPYRLYRALLAVLAAVPTWIYATPAATIPEGYTAHNVSTVEDVTTYAGRDKQAFLLEQDLIFDASPTFTTSLFFTSADAGNLVSLTFQNYNDKNVWKGEAGDSLTLQGLSVINIQNSQKSSYVPLHNNGGNVLIKENGSLVFNNNKSSSYGDGGAIHNDSGEFTLSGNGSVSFSGNSSARGGAIYNWAGTFTISSNDSLDFNNNTSADRGGAIYSSGTFTINGNGSISFSGNSSDLGGAIENSGEFTISGNDSLDFNNNIFAAYGSAIFSSGTFTISGNGSVSFSKNSTKGEYAYASGGAIFNANGAYKDNSGTFTISDNGSVTFSGNSAARGGAIDNNVDSSFTISGNRSVTFSGNSATKGIGGAIYNSGTFTINGNDSVSFIDNSSGIYSVMGGQLNIANNGTVIFRGNEGGGLTFSAETTSSQLMLSARPGGSIEFDDQVSISKTDVAGDFQVSYNQLFEDEEGVRHAQTGDIVFAGKSSRVSAMSNLYDGRLIMKDGAVYEGQGITVHSSVSGASTPTLRLGNGQLLHSGYGITVASGAALELAGVNTVTASSLTMQDGSRLNVYVGTEHADASALTLTGNWEMGGTLDINLLTEEKALAGGTYRLLTLANGQPPESWTADRITVNGLGATFDDLTWNGSTLYLTYTALTEVTWTNAAGDGLWSMAAVNWAQGDQSYAYQDGVKVVFGDAGAGEVILVGELAPSSVLVENSAGNDYSWVADAEKGGRLTGDMSLTKRGAGALSISTDHDYTGGTLIAGGTVTARSAAALGQGMVTLESATLQVDADGFSNTILSRGASCLEVTEGHVLELKATVLNEGTLTLSGAFDASALALNNFDSALIGVDGTVGTSGFRRSDGVSVTIATGTTVSDHATITHGDYTLTLGTNGIATAAGSTDYSTYHLTGTDTATTSAIHGVSATAVVSMNGGTLTVDDAATVNATGGALVLTDGALSGTLSGTTLSANSGNIDATFAGNNSIIGNGYALTSVLNNNGTLSLSGSFNASDLTLKTTDATHIDTTGQSGASGFAQEAAYSVRLAEGTTANAGASITHGDIQLTLGTDGTATAGGAVDYSTYHLTGTDAATTSAIHGVSATAVVSMNGGTLTVDDAATVNATGGALVLTDGALSGTLSGTSLTATSGNIDATFTGTNSITGNNYALTSMLNNSGTLTLSGSFDVSGLIPGAAVPPSGFVGVDGNTSTSGFAVGEKRTVTLASETTVDHGATITDGVFTYQLGTDGTATYGGGTDYSTYHLTGTDAATTSDIHGVSANATVSMNGGTLTVDDVTSVDATGGAIVLDGGTLAEDGSIQDTAVSSQGGTIDALLTGDSSLEIPGGDTSLNHADNSYTGGTEIKGGSLVVGADGALGSGLVDLQGGTLDLGGHHVGNEVLVSGGASLVGADNFTGDLKLTGNGTAHVDGYKLGAGKVFEASADGAVYEGAITLSGGTIRLKGAPLVVQGPVTFAPGAVTTIDVSLWPEEVTMENGSLLASFADNSGYSEGCLTLIGAGEDWALSFDEESGMLTLLNTALPVVDSVRAELDGNQRGAYDALKAVAADGKVEGELGRLADLVQQEKDPAAVASVLDRVNGAALAVAMSSQLEGNLAHLRRLRQNIGSGQAFDAEGRMSAYISALNEDQRLDADGSGRGYRRTEWGGQLGIEGRVDESVMLGFALSQSSARLEPTGEDRSREYIMRLDAYAAVEMGGGWQSLTSMGYGEHSFNLRREYLGGQRVQAEGVDGTSFNLMEEVNYTMSAGEKGSLQPFFAVEMSVNHLDGFDEVGAGNASLHGESRNAWAMDLTLGARYQYRFAALEKAPEATLSVQGGVVASVGDTMSDLSLNYQGAPEQKFTVRTADRNRWGYQVSAMLTLPVTPEAAFFAGGGAVMRGDSHQTNAQVGVRVNF